MMKRVAIITTNALVLAVLVAFTHSVLGGSHGLVAWLKLGESLTAAETTLAGNKAEESYLRHRITLLALDAVDADMLGELARQKNGLYLLNEIVIPLPPDTDAGAPPPIQ